MALSTLLSLFGSFVAVSGALYNDPADIPHTVYDYVVIGAGVGGGVVARRLADARYRILLIEAGPSNQGLLDVEVPFFCTNLSPDTTIDWNYTTIPQAGLGNRVVAYPRGRLLGGSSSTNYMGWTRGSKDDYDRWANVTGDPGWSWDALEPFWKAIEHITPPSDGHNTSGDVDPSVHGTNGPLGISLADINPTNAMITETTRQLSEFPFNMDMNSGNTIGIGYTQSSISNGTRDSSATAYILPALSTDTSLDVLINTQVLKILKSGTESGLPVFRGVRFAASPNRTICTVHATKEVILSAGAVSSPQVLMLSGIGNATELKATGITPIVDLPDVGQNLQDHPFIRNPFTANTTTLTFDDIRLNATLAAADLAEWESVRKGPLTLSTSEGIAWLRIPDNSSIFENHTDISAGPTSAHYELLFIDGFSSSTDPSPDSGRFYSISAAVVSPSARGSITLASANPFDLPVVNPNLLNSDVDIAIMREAIRAARRFVAAPAWAGYVTGEYGAFGRAQTDAEIDAYARNGSRTIFHPVGTARMAPFGASYGVVNPDLTVKGTKGLRVVDASIFPFIPASHTQAPTYVVAERAAHLILQAASVDAERRGT
ncbi:aryl-alcohol-oxidase from pleurotus Eryingii [Artomyces pyxidatus]|uniref:Aryl-alcohol-oxidase from pleurotus Eryingii n=1 Tax=Artomyces pyxidatus TaxID=48021 RepID=A0ACB8SQG2_9AGAM|nr:aryl-alcohol-oxidase from pleurotus Eryingii [Artomyces pyxidatus]